MFGPAPTIRRRIKAGKSPRSAVVLADGDAQVEPTDDAKGPQPVKPGTATIGIRDLTWRRWMSMFRP